MSGKAANVRAKLSNEFVTDGDLLVSISQGMQTNTAEVDAMLGGFAIDEEVSMAPQTPAPAEESVAEVKKLFDSYKSQYLQAYTP